ncbi:sigma-54 dependent transcriptional regulator [Shewanella halotolerans]|uniref:sigma-54 dependent transcriptional regulator n=1 Tax=Shewanella halotolerans TaxID=2864204 RepID=UPI001C65B1C3|nr:sigma-54 dependent transcriptional regulator [Shewanella halotolerans]QYJ88465.1 sigma-54 dependent transcriptional regulator [Shewanella halotolerans]
MSNRKRNLTHKERNILVLNLTDEVCLTDKQTDTLQWHFNHAGTLSAAYKALENAPCQIAIAIIDIPHQQVVQRAIELLSARQPGLLWLAISLDSPQNMGNLCFCFTDYFLDFHHLPLDWQRLEHTLGHLCGMAQLNEQWSKEQTTHQPQCFFFGESKVMQTLRDNLYKIAKSDETVLIGGETGTGKGLCANLIHSLSTRKNGPFITVNCGALPPTLIHSELFGHEKGAFTGADRQYIGRIERANKGTLFLDEIGDLSLELQINLLQFLEEHYIERIGGQKSTEVDCRIIFATHVNLENAVEEGKFREDLFYRINIIQIELPSLREHKQDIALLAQDYLSKLAPANRQFQFHKDALLAMTNYQWPGNVRELKNRIQRAIIMSESDTITEADLGIKFACSANDDPDVVDLAQHRTEIDTELLLAAIKRNNHNISAAARELNISRTTFYRLIKKCKITL